MYSVKEAARMMKVSEQHLRYLLAKGAVEGKKLSRDWVVLSLEYQRKRRPKRKKGERSHETSVK
jgi:transposase InsO family protein